MGVTLMKMRSEFCPNFLELPSMIIFELTCFNSQNFIFNDYLISKVIQPITSQKQIFEMGKRLFLRYCIAMKQLKAM